MNARTANPRRFRTAAATLLALALLAPGPARGAGADGSWIHVRITDSRAEGGNVNLNLPLSLADAALDLVKPHGVTGGQIKVDEGELSVAEIKRIWRELRLVRTAELLSIESQDQKVKVSRRGDLVTIDVRDRGDRREARISVAVAVVDALVSPEAADTLDLKGALAELRSAPSGELLRIEGGNSRVRVWIDDRSE